MVKKRKLVYIAGIAIVLLMLLGYKIIYKSSSTSKTSEEVHYHAGFLVFKDGKKEDFSDSKYMHMKPCEDDHDKKPTEKEIQLDKAHLHSNIGDVLHVHTVGAKWKDMLTNLNYEVDYSLTTAYLNGEKVENIKETPIVPYDSLILFIGEVNEGLLKEAVTKSRIEEVEKTTVECGT